MNPKQVIPTPITGCKWSIASVNQPKHKHTPSADGSWQSTGTAFPACHHCELRIWVWRRGIPISQELTLAANRNEQIDSPVEDTSGDKFTNMRVFESPRRHGCVARKRKYQLIHLLYLCIRTRVRVCEKWEITWSRYVNFEFLNGTCSSFFAIEEITSLKNDKLLLID